MSTQLAPFARLIFVAGDVKRATFALTTDETAIGRDAANEVVFSDASVSRRHCVITKNADGFKIVDLKSCNRTFVNEVQVEGEQTLKHGDRIRIGKIELIFSVNEDVAPDTDECFVQFDETPLAAHDTRRVQLTEAAHLMARDLSALMKISARINALQTLDALQGELLALICEVVPAERAAMLLIDERTEDCAMPDFVSVFGWQKNATTEAGVRVSRTVVEQVAREAVAIISNDDLHDATFPLSSSLIASRTASFLAVPLVYLDKTRGVIYLDTTDLLIRLTAEFLPFVSAVANIAAVALENVRRMEQLKHENEQLRLAAAATIDHNMIGESPAMREVYRLIARVAPTDATVLIGGESGTGKELAARAIHANSSRKDKPFIAINCAALTETLLESELFGHEKGAFTGAVAQKKGKLEVADGGTLFLDEIAELAPTLQAKLLRVLQERSFERVGGTRTLKVDVRLVAATNKDLESAIAGGTFRADLYYRLNVVAITMPPLRERLEDVLPLANHFAAKSGLRCRRRVTGISPAAQKYLTSYDFPGNVRELENAIERAVVLGSTEHILPEDLPEALLEIEQAINADAVDATTYHEAIRVAKKALIINAVRQANGNFTEAAKLLEVHPNYLHRLIRNLNLREQVEMKTTAKAR